MGQVTSNDELRGLNQLPFQTQKGTTHQKKRPLKRPLWKGPYRQLHLMFWQFNTSKPWYNTPVNTYSDKYFVLEGLVTLIYTYYIM